MDRVRLGNWGKYLGGGTLNDSNGRTVAWPNQPAIQTRGAMVLHRTTYILTGGRRRIIGGKSSCGLSAVGLDEPLEPAFTDVVGGSSGVSPPIQDAVGSQPSLVGLWNAASY